MLIRLTADIYNSIVYLRIKPSILDKRKLNKTQADSLCKLLYNTKTYGGYPPQCHDNQLGIIYYQSGKMISFIGVSLSCGGLFPAHNIYAMEQESFRDKKYNYAYYSGLGKKGKANLINFFTSLKMKGFQYKLKPMK